MMYTLPRDLLPVEADMFLLPEMHQESVPLSHRNSRFLHVLDGVVCMRDEAGTLTLRKGDILYIASGHAYRLTATAPSVLLYVGFHPCFLLSTIGFSYGQLAFHSASVSFETAMDFRQIIAALAADCLGNARTASFTLYAHAYEAVELMHRHMIERTEPTDQEQRSESKLRALQELLRTGYASPISLQQVANELSYTPQYLANLIQKNLQTTFLDLLNSYRLDAALTFMLHTTESLPRIACLCGFPNQASFQKAFIERYQMPPPDYLALRPFPDCIDQDQSFTKITHPSSFRNYLLNYMDYAGEPGYAQENSICEQHRIRVTGGTELAPYWKRLINLGTAEDLEKPAFRKHLAMLQKDLRFEYGRIMGCLPLARVHQIDQEYSYDFSIIYEVIDFLRSLGLKPFLDIDTKPFRIYKDGPPEFEAYDIFLKTKQYDAFLFDLLPHFIKACINRYGFDEFSTWKFELWRRYNPTMTSLEPPADFVRRYARVANVFQGMNCQFSLGGPAFNAYLDINHFEELLKEFRRQGVQPDFFSAICFPYEAPHADRPTDRDGYQITQSPNTMLNRVQAMRQALELHGYAQAPFYITEYTSYILTGNYINDSTYPATYIFRQVIDNYGKVDALGYWLASDISLEHKQASAPLFGGNGMISRNGIKKSAFYAYDFLNQLGPYLVARGEYFIVTKSDDFHYQILAFYNSNIGTYSSEDPMSAEMLRYPYYGFAEIQPLALLLELSGLRPGVYRIREQTLDLTSGNVLHVWGQLDHMKYLLPADIDYLKNQSSPSVRQHQEDVPGTLNMSVRLGQNEAKLFHLSLYQPR